MIPIRLELTNFLAYKNPAPLDFTGIHVAVLTGENGAGKSSLLDALTWALWGRARARTDAELIHSGQSEMRVEFMFALGDQHYRVVRAKRAKGGGGVLDFQILNAEGKWAGLAEATIPKTQDKITQTLRLNYETFVNSAYLMQGKADEFTAKRPTERKQVLSEILGIQEWERYEDRAKQKVKDIDSQLARLAEMLRDIETELGRQSDYERELTDAQTKVIEVAARLREAESGWAQIESARQALVTLQKQVDDLDKRLRDAEKELAALDHDLREAQSRADSATINRDLEAAQNRLTQLEARETERETATRTRQHQGELAAQLRGENEAAKLEADTLKKRVETLQTATEPRCPTCGQPLSESERATLVAELNTEVEARRERYRVNQAQLKTLADEQAGLDKTLTLLNADLRDKPNLIKRLADLQAALVQAAEAAEKIAGLTERRQRWFTSIESDREQLNQLDAQAEQYNRILRDSAVKQRALDTLRNEDTLTKAKMGAAQQRLASLTGLAKQRDSKRAEHTRLADERGLYDELRDAFGKKGVPALMIEAAVPEIEASANALLNRMTNGRMHLRFQTQKETQAGETRETLDIQISDELGTRAYEMYSGGEAFRVNFAVRLALSQLLARRAGTQLQTLIVDEGFGVLDASGRERLVEAIHAAQGDFQRILVVTHLDELKDAFPARIEITKGPNGSEIAVM
jgi:exonuclease SbcC